MTPAVRALAWGAKSLFGVDRVTTLADWPLNARLATVAGRDGFDPAKTWTIVAGGDVMLDRGVAKVVKIQGKGADFPFNGGTADDHRAAVLLGVRLPVPATARTGGAGAVRDLLKSADLAVANFENPAPDAFRYHTQGTVFSADPKLIAGLKEAGIDASRSATTTSATPAAKGILDTIKNLKKNGIKSTGAGQEPGGRAQAGAARGQRHQGRDPRLRHDRQVLRGGTLTRPAAPSCRGRSSRPTSRRPGRPAPTS